MKSMICLGLLLPLCLCSCSIGGSSEEYYETYEDFKKHWGALAGFLPNTSKEILHYAVLDFDTNYHFIEATVQLENLKEFVKSKNGFSSKHVYPEVSYSQYKFDQLFYEKPNWWNQSSVFEYEENQLLVFGDKNNYGEGYWFFYDNDNSKIRLFTWSQQWLSQEKVIKTLNL